MALVLHRHHTLSGPGRLARGAAHLLAIARRASDWPGRVIRHRRLLNAMAGMSEHELRDIGLATTDIRDATAVRLGEDPSALLRIRRQDRLAGRHGSTGSSANGSTGIPNSNESLVGCVRGASTKKIK